VSLAATEPTKQIDVTLHFLQLLLVAFCCQAVPLAVSLMLLSIVRFSVKVVSQLVSGKNLSRGWWRWDNISELFWHDDWGLGVRKSEELLLFNF
jgi:hypothetical protein